MARSYSDEMVWLYVPAGVWAALPLRLLALLEGLDLAGCHRIVTEYQVVLHLPRELAEPLRARLQEARESEEYRQWLEEEAREALRGAGGSGPGQSAAGPGEMVTTVGRAVREIRRPVEQEDDDA